MSKTTAAQQRLLDNAVLISATRLLFDSMRKHFPTPKLNELVTIHNGQGLSATDRDETGMFNVYAAGGLVGRHSTQLSDKPFVVIGRKGSAGKPTYAPFGGWVIDTAYYAQPKDENRLDSKFLFYAISSLDFKGDVIATAIPGINRTSIYTYSVPLPPVDVQQACVRFLDRAAAIGTGEFPALPHVLSEQRRIVARIEELTEKIAEARSLRHQAGEEATAFLTASRRAAILDCEAETIDLEDACLEIIDNLHSNPRYAETGIPCIRSPDVGYGTLNLDGALRTDEAEYRHRTVRGEPQSDDIVLVREGGGTGKCALVSPGERLSLGQRVMMLRPNQERVLPRFFLYQLLSPLVQKDQIAPLSKGSASPHLNIGALKRFSLRIPPLHQQRSIVAYLDDLQAKVDTLKKLQTDTAAELNALLPSILDKAFKGEL